MPRIEVGAQRCKGCGFCVKFCPKNLIHLNSDFNNKGYHPAVFTSEEECTGCAICALVCPDIAITVYK
ncbi:4Fe-4S dicluster domain-containing protein [Candidatus Aerophobetes bacterium]|uniref:4Fe-4S dicluster domain-containing protein n=1 Tax=Aerophobetes bacterium TaxID=2030807 RepID=A0A523RR48_UNCAE|nr:MAG: 4Fe-4S dicluster domain-containing protein [Candidatus Aerophobetes bacterium]